jgi:type IV secretory pathway VirB4 component
MEEYDRYRYERSLEAFSEAELLAEHGKWNSVVNRLFDYRQKGDYGDLFDFDEPMVKPLFAPVRELIGRVGELV